MGVAVAWKSAHERVAPASAAEVDVGEEQESLQAIQRLGLALARQSQRVVHGASLERHVANAMADSDHAAALAPAGVMGGTWSVVVTLAGHEAGVRASSAGYSKIVTEDGVPCVVPCAVRLKSSQLVGLCDEHLHATCVGACAGAPHAQVEIAAVAESTQAKDPSWSRVHPARAV